MGKKYWSLLLIIAVSSLFGTYIKNYESTLIQPDGSKISCFSSGDEFFNYLHDADGYSIIQSNLDGYYYYAIKDSEGNIVPSSFRADKTKPRSSLVKGALLSEDQYRERVASFKGSRSRAGNGVYVGEYNNLCFLIRFADQTEFTTPRSMMEEKFNGVSTPSLKNYFKEITYNKLNFTTHIFPVITDKSKNLSFQDKKPRAYYLPYNSVTNPIGFIDEKDMRKRRDTLIYNAVTALAPQVSASINIDSDNDRWIDNMTFIVRGELGTWSQLLWPHQAIHGSPDPVVNNISGSSIVLLPEPRSDLQTTAHEMLHVFGAPDLYHYFTKDYDMSSVGNWDISDNGSGHPLTYSKWKYSNRQWVANIPEITSSGTYKLKPTTTEIGSCYKIRSKVSNQYYLVEYRKKSGFYESQLPGSGLIVYRINEGNYGNGEGPPDETYLYRHNGNFDENGDLSLAYFSKDCGRTSINNDSPTKPFIWVSKQDYKDGDLNITEIGSAGDEISFKVEISSGNSSEKPTVEPIFPVANADLSATWQLFKVKVLGYNGTHVLNCAFYLDGKYLGTQNYSYAHPSEFWQDFDATGVSLGKHILKVVPTDAYNYTTTLEIPFNLVAISESFEGEFPPQNWTNQGWVQSDKLASGFNRSAYASFEASGTSTLTTPSYKIDNLGYIEFYWANADFLTERSLKNGLKSGRNRADSEAYFELFDGSAWQRVVTLDKSTLDKEFEKVVLDLTPYLGKNLSFRWIHKGSGSLENIGTAIDEFKFISYSTNGFVAKILNPNNNQIVDNSKGVDLVVGINKVSSEIDKVELFIDGNFISRDSDYPYQFALNSNVLANGSHQLRIEATAKNGTKALDEIYLTTNSSGAVVNFGRSPNGYGWYKNHNRKVSYDPFSNQLNVAYRKQYLDDAGDASTTAGLTGMWGNLKDNILISSFDGVTTRYPHTFAVKDYLFTTALYSESWDVGVDSKISLQSYNTKTNLWSKPVIVKAANGSAIPNVWTHNGEATIDNSGKIRTIFVATDDLDKYNYAVVSGSSSDGQNWTFSDYKNNYLTKTTDFFDAEIPKAALSSSGFGIVMSRVQPLNSVINHKIGYFYTDNYGDNFTYNTDNSGKFFVLDNLTLFPWLGKNSGGAKVDICKLGMDFDLTIVNNTVHFVIDVKGYSSSNGKLVKELDDKTPVSGIYDIIGTKSGSAISWKAKFIAHRVGWNLADDKNIGSDDGFERGDGRCQIGSAGNVLYITWADRPHKNLAISEKPGSEGWQVLYKTDGYFSFSKDNGESWICDNKAPWNDGRTGINITNSPSLTEDGFGCSKNGKLENDILSFYVAYQAPISYLPLYPNSQISDFTTELFVQKVALNVNNLSIVESVVDLDTKLLQNYPNPFNPDTKINFQLKNEAECNLSVYNVKGELVMTLVNSKLAAGDHTFHFNGNGLNSGVYFYKLSTPQTNMVKKMLLVK